MIIIITGLALVLFSLAALAYAFGPAAVLHDEVMLAPTLFSPP